MGEHIATKTMRAAKPHRCYDCGRMIPRGARYVANVACADDAIYTLRSHGDCHAAALDYIAEGYLSDYDDGAPPLYEMIEAGDGQLDLDAMRGYWPHVVCRIELGYQLSEIAAEIARNRREGEAVV